MQITAKTIAMCASAVVLANTAIAAPRDIQIRTINFDTGIVELHNFGTQSQSLDGWRFCTHDEDEARRYSAAGGLNLQTIHASGSLFVHFNNDAGVLTPNAINISSITGEFALPLDIGSYGMGLYANSGFEDGNNLADHLQWSPDGLDNFSADERSDEAVAGLVWSSETEWIATDTSTTYIRLVNSTPGGATGSSNINSPADYDALPGFDDCQPNGIDDFLEILDGAADSEPDGIPDVCQLVTECCCWGDSNRDGAVNVTDISTVLFRLGDNAANNCTFSGVGSFDCPGICMGDVNGDGHVDVNDISFILHRLGSSVDNHCPSGVGGPCP